jgi:hypothetical protein
VSRPGVRRLAGSDGVDGERPHPARAIPRGYALPRSAALRRVERGDTPPGGCEGSDAPIAASARHAAHRSRSCPRSWPGVQGRMGGGDRHGTLGSTPERAPGMGRRSPRDARKLGARISSASSTSTGAGAPGAGRGPRPGAPCAGPRMRAMWWVDPAGARQVQQTEVLLEAVFQRRESRARPGRAAGCVSRGRLRDDYASPALMA